MDLINDYDEYESTSMHSITPTTFNNNNNNNNNGTENNLSVENNGSEMEVVNDEQPVVVSAEDLASTALSEQPNKTLPETPSIPALSIAERSIQSIEMILEENNQRNSSMPEKSLQDACKALNQVDLFVSLLLPFHISLFSLSLSLSLDFIVFRSESFLS
jgi:hypothetical protein